MLVSNKVEIGYKKTCSCPDNHINCLTAKEWLKSQVAVQSFYYKSRDVRDKDIHPAVYPIALPSHFIKLFTHQGELVIDPFAGIGTTLLAARDLDRNAVGFDLKEEYIEYSKKRLEQTALSPTSQQIPICDDALNIANYVEENSVSLCVTSPPYANMLNHRRLNKSIRGNARENKHFLKVQQYSNKPRDLGQMNTEEYPQALTEIYKRIFPLVRPKGHVVINVNDVWDNNRRYATHIYVVKAIEASGFEFRNTIIWDKRDLVNNVGIYGWPNNFITLGTTMEFILHFWRPS